MIVVGICFFKRLAVDQQLVHQTLVVLAALDNIPDVDCIWRRKGKALFHDVPSLTLCRTVWPCHGTPFQKPAHESEYSWCNLLDMEGGPCYNGGCPVWGWHRGLLGRLSRCLFFCLLGCRRPVPDACLTLALQVRCAVCSLALAGVPQRFSPCLVPFDNIIIIYLRKYIYWQNAQTIA